MTRPAEKFEFTEMKGVGPAHFHVRDNSIVIKLSFESQRQAHDALYQMRQAIDECGQMALRFPKL